MKRILIVCLALLPACVSEEEAQAQAVIQSACEAGDVQACVAIQQSEAAKRQALAAGVRSMGNSMQAAAQNRPTTTNCIPTYGGGVNCTQW